MPRKPTIFGQAKRGDIILDCIGERFLVLGKNKTTLFVADLQDRGFRIDVPRDFVNECGVSLNKSHTQHPYYQRLLIRYPDIKEWSSR